MKASLQRTLRASILGLAAKRRKSSAHGASRGSVWVDNEAKKESRRDGTLLDLSPVASHDRNQLQLCRAG